MFENCDIKEDRGHPLQGPHLDTPADFVPLRLRTEPEQILIEVDCPSVVVGRHAGSRLRLAYPDVSRRHCRISFEQGEWRIRDLRSLNGVFLNGEPILEATIYAGDRLRIGSVHLLVEAATSVRLLAAAGAREHEKLRQIVQSLPAE